MSPEFYWVAVALVTTISAARLTRLITYDKFPPVAWLRDQYADFTDRWEITRGWQLLAFCGYCASFWVTLGVVAWGWLSDFDTAWWLTNSVLASSYVAAVFMANDGDIDDETHVVITESEN